MFDLQNCFTARVKKSNSFSSKPFKLFCVHTDSFECCSAKCESYQMDWFATSYKRALGIWLFWKDFSTSQICTTAILLSYPDSFLLVCVRFDRQINPKNWNKSQTNLSQITIFTDSILEIFSMNWSLSSSTIKWSFLIPNLTMNISDTNT